VKDRQVLLSQPKGLNSSTAVAAFLDDPETSAKSAISLQFSPVAELQSVADALVYITKAGPIPFLLCRCGTVDSKEVTVASVGGPTELVFSRQPPTGSKDGDLAEILDWFQKVNVAVDLLERSVTEWYPQQFSGAQFWRGLSIDSGWMQIVDDACSQIQSTLTAEELREFHWLQIKQENAGLTMFWGPAYRTVLDPAGPHHGMDFESETVVHWRFDEAESNFTPATRKRVLAIIANAQTRAAHTCEHCGGAGLLQRESLTVLCEVCCKRWEQVIREDEALQRVQAQLPPHVAQT
jgi:hypothetical protein